MQCSSWRVKLGPVWDVICANGLFAACIQLCSCACTCTTMLSCAESLRRVFLQLCAHARMYGLGCVCERECVCGCVCVCVGVCMCVCTRVPACAHGCLLSLPSILEAASSCSGRRNPCWARVRDNWREAAGCGHSFPWANHPRGTFPG
jgi:hypothetical protein